MLAPELRSLGPALEQGAAVLGVALSPPQVERLLEYMELLEYKEPKLHMAKVFRRQGQQYMLVRTQRLSTRLQLVYNPHDGAVCPSNVRRKPA